MSATSFSTSEGRSAATAPGDRAAPVVADDDRPLAAECPDERRHVVDERPEVVRPLQLRLAVAAQVGCDRPVAGAGRARAAGAATSARARGSRAGRATSGPSSGPSASAWNAIPFAVRIERTRYAGPPDAVGESSHRPAAMDIWRRVANASSVAQVSANAVLLAEHEPSSREYLEQQLRDDGFTVFERSLDGARARPRGAAPPRCRDRGRAPTSAAGLRAGEPGGRGTGTSR